MRLRTDAKRAELSDYMGNRTEVPVVDGEVEFVLDANPKALLLWDAERIFNFQFSGVSVKVEHRRLKIEN